MSNASASSSKKGVKKGKLFVSCHFQKLPDEMSISPALVDFLTQVRDDDDIVDNGVQDDQEEEEAEETSNE